MSIYIDGGEREKKLQFDYILKIFKNFSLLKVSKIG